MMPLTRLLLPILCMSFHDIPLPVACDTTMCFFSQQRTVVVLMAWPGWRTANAEPSCIAKGSTMPAYSVSIGRRVVAMDASIQEPCSRKVPLASWLSHDPHCYLRKGLSRQSLDGSGCLPHACPRYRP